MRPTAPCPPSVFMSLRIRSNFDPLHLPLVGARPLTFLPGPRGKSSLTPATPALLQLRATAIEAVPGAGTRLGPRCRRRSPKPPRSPACLRAANRLLLPDACDPGVVAG